MEIVTDALDRLTTQAHNRIMVVEVMGRHSGWIALTAGLAAGAEANLILDRPFDLDVLSARLQGRLQRSRDYSSIVVRQEGCPIPKGQQVLADTDSLGFARYGGVALAMADELEQTTAGRQGLGTY